MPSEHQHACVEAIDDFSAGIQAFPVGCVLPPTGVRESHGQTPPSRRGLSAAADHGPDPEPSSPGRVFGYCQRNLRRSRADGDGAVAAAAVVHDGHSRRRRRATVAGRRVGHCTAAAVFIIDAYVASGLSPATKNATYSREQTLRSFSETLPATLKKRGQSEFLVERMQPDWCESSLQWGAYRGGVLVVSSVAVRDCLFNSCCGWSEWFARQRWNCIAASAGGESRQLRE